MARLWIAPFVAVVSLLISAGSGAAAQPLPDTLFLTWFDDPTTTVAVQWLHRGASPPRATGLEVIDAPAAGGEHRSSVRPFGDAGGYWVQRIEVRGLTPDAAYAFRVPELGVEGRFRTAAAKLHRPLVFAQGGDIGTDPVVADLHRVAASWDPLFAVVGGDLAYADNDEPEKWVRYLQLWHDHMRTAEGRLIPMLVCIGNHEVDGGMNGGRDDAALFYSLFDGLFRETGYAALDVGGDASFLLLDSAHTTPIEGAQTTWLARAVAERAGRTHLFPVYHVPMYPSVRDIHDGARGRARRAMRERWRPLFEVVGVRLAFEHDDHAYKRTYPQWGSERDDRGIVYLGDGSWGRRTRSVDPRRPYLAEAERTHCVNRIEAHPDGRIDVLVLDEDGDEVDRFTIEPRE